jgi:carbon-monoxide dehydrogenase medium subunit
MKAAAFDYHRPATVADAVGLLAKLAPEGGRVLAGGQSLVPMMAFRLARPTHLIDINHVAGLRELGEHDGWLHIGAGVRHAALARPGVPGCLGALLGRVVKHIAHAPIRARGTFGGSIAHADPASEWCLVAATLDAVMTAQSARGAREIPAAEFFQTVMTTALHPDELLTRIALPVLPDRTRFGFDEFSRRVGDFAMAMALVTFRVEGGVIVAPRVGVGGAEAAPRRVPEAEAVLDGAPPDAATFDVAAAAAADAIDPLVDQQTDAEYRRALARAVVRRALDQAAL